MAPATRQAHLELAGMDVDMDALDTRYGGLEGIGGFDDVEGADDGVFEKGVQEVFERLRCVLLALVTMLAQHPPRPKPS